MLTNKDISDFITANKHVINTEPTGLGHHLMSFNPPNTADDTVDIQTVSQMLQVFISVSGFVETPTLDSNQKRLLLAGIKSLFEKIDEKNKLPSELRQRIQTALAKHATVAAQPAARQPSPHRKEAKETTAAKPKASGIDFTKVQEFIKNYKKNFAGSYAYEIIDIQSELTAATRKPDLQRILINTLFAKFMDSNFTLSDPAAEKARVAFRQGLFEILENVSEENYKSLKDQEDVPRFKQALEDFKHQKQGMDFGHQSHAQLLESVGTFHHPHPAENKTPPKERRAVEPAKPAPIKNLDDIKKRLGNVVRECILSSGENPILKQARDTAPFITTRSEIFNILNDIFKYLPRPLTYTSPVANIDPDLDDPDLVDREVHQNFYQRETMENKKIHIDFMECVLAAADIPTINPDRQALSLGAMAWSDFYKKYCPKQDQKEEISAAPSTSPSARSSH